MKMIETQIFNGKQQPLLQSNFKKIALTSLDFARNFYLI